jgi:beta-lactamase class A
VTFTRDDIRSISPVTQNQVDSGMTISELCDAAVRYSDGTAGNLLLDDIGGPAGLTDYLRSLGDKGSRMDNYEPELNRDVPGDELDITTPRAIATDYRTLVLGSALPDDRGALLTDWLPRSTTAPKRIRIAVPEGWSVADKTGTGDYGRANDIAIVRPPSRAPLVLAIMSDRVGGRAVPCLIVCLRFASGTCVQVASAGARPNVGTRLGSLNAVMRPIRAPIKVRTWTPYASYRLSPARA